VRFNPHQDWLAVEKDFIETTDETFSIGVAMLKVSSVCGAPHKRKNWLFVGSARGGETAATCFSILAGDKRHKIKPFAYVRDLLVAISTGESDWNALLPDVWIAAHPEHFLHYRQDEAETAVRLRRRRRAGRRARKKHPGSTS
jgi:hypothetical protein